MTEPAQRVVDSSETDHLLAEVLDEIAWRLRDGEAVDVTNYVSAHPELASELDRLLPAMEVLADFGVSTANSSALASPLPRGLDAGVGQLGDFRIVGEIGRGGMGVVYEAQQITLERRVALKMLPLAAVFDERRITRFRNEAKMAATLKHPNIVSVFAVGCERGVHYYAMEFVEGHSLAEVIRHLRADDGGHDATAAAESETTQTIAALLTQRASDRRQYHRVITRLVAEVGEALHHAHCEGIVHRDIKPSNILLDKDGKALIADFGLAHMRGEGSLTLSGDVLGTVRYMSPEQASGQTVLDQRTDVYSLGITLYELLTLKPAFGAPEHRTVLNAIAEEEPTPPRKVDASVPIDLETIVLKATAKPADARYGTAKELADDLRRYLSDKPVKARRTGRATRLRRWARRNPWLAASMTLVFLLMTVLATGGIATSLHLGQLNDIANQKLYLADITQAKLAIDLGDYLSAESYLSRHEPRSGEDPRGFEWFHLWNLCHEGAPKLILSHGLNVASIAYSPDGQLVATAPMYGGVHLWNARTGRPVRRIRAHRGWINSMQFSKDSLRLATAGRDGRVCIADVATGDLCWSISVKPEDQSVTDVLLSPDERTVAIAHSRVQTVFPTDQPGTVSVWDITSKKKLLEDESLRGRVRLASSPDGDFLAAVSLDGGLRVWSTENWNPVHSAKAHKTGVFAVAFSPVEKTLVTGSGVWHDRFVMGEVKLWSTESWEMLDEIHCGSGQTQSLAYSPDGRFLAIGSYDRMISLVELQNDTFHFRGEVAAHIGKVADLAFSPDGQFLFTGSSDNSARLWPFDRFEHRVRRASIAALGNFNSVRFIGDGQVCAVDFHGTAYVIDVMTQEIVYTLEHDLYSSHDIDVSSDQKLLALALGHYPPNGKSGWLYVYQVDTGREVWSVELPHGHLKGVAFSPDRQMISVTSAKTLLVADLLHRTITPVDHYDSWAKCVHYTPDGERLACTADTGKTFFYDAQSLERLKTLNTDERGATAAIDFSTDGTYFITGGADRTIKTWDAKSYRSIRETSKQAPGHIFRVEISPDGRRYYSVGEDGSVTLWHPELGEPSLTLPVDHHWIWNGGFSQSGEAIATGGKTGLRIWHGRRVDGRDRLANWQLPIVCSTEEFRGIEQEDVTER